MCITSRLIIQNIGASAGACEVFVRVGFVICEGNFPARLPPPHGSAPDVFEGGHQLLAQRQRTQLAVVAPVGHGVPLTAEPLLGFARLRLVIAVPVKVLHVVVPAASPPAVASVVGELAVARAHL